MNKKLSFTLVTALGVVAASQAQFALVTNRGAINQNDSIQWNQFGGDFTVIGGSANGATTNNVLFNVTGPGANQEIRQQPNGWIGNFSQGDFVLWSRDPGSTTLTLAQTVGAIGFQIQADENGAPFTALIAAYDGLGNLLGSFSENGLGNANNDGSAIFIGVTTGNNKNNIAKIVFSTLDQNGGRISEAINQVSIHECNPVPEPSSIAVLGLGAVALLRRRRK